MPNANLSLADYTGRTMAVHNQEEGTLGPDHLRNGFANRGKCGLRKKKKI